jgi:hypothetical protein
MRARNIKPNFFIDSKTGKLPYIEKVFFIGLWCIADREGYFSIDYDEMKVQIFPYDSKVKIHKLLCNLMSCHLITFNDTHGYIKNFDKHQKPHPHEAKSTVSAEVKKTLKNQCNDMSLNVTKCSADIRNDDIRNDNIPSSKNNDGAFALLWEKYPINREKKSALEYFNKQKYTVSDIATMHDNLDKQIAHKAKCDGNGKFCPEFPYMVRWLKRDLWREVPESKKASAVIEKPVIDDCIKHITNNVGGKFYCECNQDTCKHIYTTECLEQQAIAEVKARKGIE